MLDERESDNADRTPFYTSAPRRHHLHEAREGERAISRRPLVVGTSGKCSTKCLHNWRSRDSRGRHTWLERAPRPPTVRNNGATAYLGSACQSRSASVILLSARPCLDLSNSVSLCPSSGSRAGFALATGCKRCKLNRVANLKRSSELFNAKLGAFVKLAHLAKCVVVFVSVCFNLDSSAGWLAALVVGRPTTPSGPFNTKPRAGRTLEPCVRGARAL